MTLPPDHSGPPLPTAQAVLTIDLGALADNWRKLRDLCAPAECSAVVKANAYGIGVEPVVGALAAAGCHTFFVAQISEGARLRKALEGFFADTRGFRIYCLNGMLPGSGVTEALIEHGLRPVIGSRDELQRWIKSGDIHLPHIPIALQFNTGMNRLGIEACDAQDVLDALRAARMEGHVDLVMTHFVSSEIEDDRLNSAQILAFEKVRAVFTGFRASLANSSGVFLPQRPHYDLVRPGYALYGGNPTPGKPNPMQSVVRLQAPIIQLRMVEPGETAGYNGQWIAQKSSRLATIGVGYADGMPRSAMHFNHKPGGQALVAGKICPFVGRVSMDLIILDVSDVPESALAPGVMAELLGDRITIDELAERAGTIGYEILTSLGPRYHRIYRNGN